MDEYWEIGKINDSNYLCLEFANTVSWHASEHAEENLHNYADLVNWIKETGNLPKAQANALLINATKHPSQAKRAYSQAISVREAIYRIFVAIIRNEHPAEDDLNELNTILADLTEGAQIIHSGKLLQWKWLAKTNTDSLDAPIWPIVISAAELLVSEKCKRVGQCADESGCGWLFLDTSKNHSRRWCDSTDCGNRARQRLHYERSRGQN